MSDVGDVLRGLAEEGPSDEGLLAGVHAAAARAAVRRRVLLSSAAAVAVLLGGIGVLSATGSDEPATRDLVLGTTATPTPESSPEPTQTGAPVTRPTGSRPAETDGPSATYRGRAVGPDGAPIPGLYVQVVRQDPFWSPAPVAARTDARGEFDIPCPEGAVVLSAFRLGAPVPPDAPSWRTTYVGGGWVLGQARIPSCTQQRETTRVPEGAVVQGTLRSSARCAFAGWSIRLTGTTATGQVGLDQEWLTTVVDPGGAFRVPGFPPGTYAVTAYPDYTGSPRTVSGGVVEISGSGPHDVTVEVEADDCLAPLPSSSTTAEPAPEPSGSVTPEPEPTPSA